VISSGENMKYIEATVMLLVYIAQIVSIPVGCIILGVRSDWISLRRKYCVGKGKGRLKTSDRRCFP